MPERINPKIAGRQQCGTVLATAALPMTDTACLMLSLNERKQSYPVINRHTPCVAARHEGPSLQRIMCNKRL